MAKRTLSPDDSQPEAPIALDNLPGNSQRERLELEKSNPTEKAIRPVVSGTVKKLAPQRNSQISEDIRKIFAYVFAEILIPAAKSTIQDIVTSGIDMILYGEDSPRTRSGRRNRTGSVISYGGFFDSGRSQRRYENRSRVRETERAAIHVATDRYEPLVFDEREDAVEVLNGMLDLLEQYQQVTVADLYELASVERSDFALNKWGWTNLQKAGVQHIREGWALMLPKPYELS